MCVCAMSLSRQRLAELPRNKRHTIAVASCQTSRRGGWNTSRSKVCTLQWNLQTCFFSVTVTNLFSVYRLLSWMKKKQFGRFKNLSVLLIFSDVKRGQLLEAKAEDKSLRTRTRTKLRGQGQFQGQKKAVLNK